MHYPSIDEYVAGLPEGWASFPDCLVSSELVGGLRERGVLDDLDDLPEVVVELVRDPGAPPWIPETALVGALLAVRDARFAGHGDDLAFLQWVESLNRMLFRAPTYTQTFEAQRPAEVIRRIPEVWSRFHLGTSMSVVSLASDEARVVFAHPASLFPAISIETRRRAIAVAMASAGAAQPDVRAEPDPRGTAFALRWASDPRR